MDRDKVDPDSNQTCSTGLHAAAFEYADGMYQGGSGILVEVKINPENVVAVPTDYNEQKMRVCEYIVIRECEGKRNEVLVTDDEFDNYDDDYDDNDQDATVEVADDIVEVADTTPGVTSPVIAAVDVDKDGRGRVAIPKAFVQQLGVGPFDHVVAYADVGISQVIVDRKNQDVPDEHTVYTVDRSGNVRVTNSLLAKAGLDQYDTFTIRFQDDQIIIE